MPMAKPPPAAGRLTPDPPHRPLPPCLLWGVHRTPEGVLFFSLCYILREPKRKGEREKEEQRKVKGKGEYIILK